MATTKKSNLPLWIGGGIVAFLLLRTTQGYSNLNKYLSKDIVTRSKTAEINNITEQFNPPNQIYKNADFLAEHVINPIIEKFGVDNIDISSWYRSNVVNKEVGGVVDSHHLMAFAVDLNLIVEGKNQYEELLQFIANSNLPFTELAIEGSNYENFHIHISYIPNRIDREVVIMIPGQYAVHDFEWLKEKFG